MSILSWFKDAHAPYVLGKGKETTVPMAFQSPGKLPDFPEKLNRRLLPESWGILTKWQKGRVEERLHAILKEADKMWKSGNVPEIIDNPLYTDCVKASMLVYLLCRQRGYPARTASCIVRIPGSFKHGTRPQKHMVIVSCGYVLDILSNNYNPQPTTCYNAQFYRVSGYDLSKWYDVKPYKYLNDQVFSKEQIRRMKN